MSMLLAKKKLPLGGRDLESLGSLSYLLNTIDPISLSIEVGTSVLSVISSLILVSILYREGLKDSLYNRIYFFMAISALGVSFSSACSTLPIPTDTLYTELAQKYYVLGNIFTCNLQAALNNFSAIVFTLESCLLCLYFLVKIFLNKSENYVPKMAELLIHLLIMTFAGVMVHELWIRELFNTVPLYGLCDISPLYPLWCDGANDETLTCKNSRGNMESFLPIANVEVINMYVVVAIALCCFVLIVYEIFDRERKLNLYIEDFANDEGHDLLLYNIHDFRDTNDGDRIGMEEFRRRNFRATRDIAIQALVYSVYFLFSLMPLVPTSLLYHSSGQMKIGFYVRCLIKLCYSTFSSQGFWVLGIYLWHRTRIIKTVNEGISFLAALKRAFSPLSPEERVSSVFHRDFVFDGIEVMEDDSNESADPYSSQESKSEEQQVREILAINRFRVQRLLNRFNYGSMQASSAISEEGQSPKQSQDSTSRDNTSMEANSMRSVGQYSQALSGFFESPTRNHSAFVFKKSESKDSK